MNWLQRFVRWLTGDLPEKAPPPPAEEAPTREMPNAPARDVDPANDAGAYGVTITRLNPRPGTTYWRVKRVHHLTPAENGGNHHIYVDALDEAGKRIYGSQAKVTWAGGEQTLTVDKPANEAGTNYPVYKWQKCAVEMAGAPSDTVHGLSSSHPDEPNPDGSQSGNTLFHHSFLVEFQRTLAAPTESAPPPPAAAGIIQGRVNGGEGLTLQLHRAGELLAQGKLGKGGAFRLRSLDPGVYTLRIRREGDPTPVVASDPITVSGADPVQIDLAVPGSEPAPVPTPVPLPAPGYLFDRYVLFGPTDQPVTRVHLLLLTEKLAAQAIPFGFRADEAAHAAHVIIIGGQDGVSAQVASDLVAQGVTVRRVAGDAQRLRDGLKG